MSKNDPNRVLVFDTTLRDGEQSPGISLGTREKLEIAEQLERMGVDIIEAGFPITSPGDFEAVSAIAARLKTATVAGLARAVDRDVDRAWEALKTAAHPRIHTFVMTSDMQIEHQLRKGRDDVIRMADVAIRRAKGYCDDIEFSPMDATRSDFEFLVRVLDAAIEAGATTLNIPDTVGYALPSEFGAFIAALRQRVAGADTVTWSVHCHNDLGLAVANSLAAIEVGATQIECAMNGLGERAGNTSVEELAMIIATRSDRLGKRTGIITTEITRTSRLVSSLTGYQVQYNKAIVGRNAFAHSSGIHQDGVLKHRSTYEIIDPVSIGLTKSQLILGKTSGRNAVRTRLGEIGYQLSDEEFERAFARFKDLADKKDEVSDADLEAIVADDFREAASQGLGTIDYLLVHSETGEKPRASVRIRKGDELIDGDSEGDGPVDAACRAVSVATGVETKLLSYNVSSITEGLDAQGDVSIQLEIDGATVVGRGVSTDIIIASARAYLNAVNVYEVRKRAAELRAEAASLAGEPSEVAGLSTTGV